MRVLTMLSVVLVVLPALLRAQVENRAEQSASDVPDYYLDLVSFQSPDSDQTRIDIYAQIPYDVLKFVSSNGGFLARYEMTINVFGADGGEVVEKIWNEDVRVKTFDETQSKKAFSLTQRSIVIHPGSYVLRAQLRELESRKSSVQVRKLTLQNYASSDFAISDVMLINRVAHEAGHLDIAPNISGNLYNNPAGFFLFFELYNVSKADSAVLVYTVLDKKDRAVYSQIQRIALEGKKTRVVAKMDSSRYPVGAYQLHVDARTVPNARDSAVHTAQRSRGFVMRWGNTPLTVVDIDLAIRQTRYIATDKEYDAMTDATTLEEKQRLFQEFWRKRDPSPDTQRNEYMEEYYSRVQYSNEHFSHYIEGWRTDMGMVFIILGSPNNVDRHPFDYDSKPFEVWSYYEYNRQVVFVDETGFGDYKLLTPIWDLLRRGK